MCSTETAGPKASPAGSSTVRPRLSLCSLAEPLTGSKAYTESAIDASIARLGCTPDAWALHRIDPKVPIEESVAAMEAARQAGKTKYIGLSEVSYPLALGKEERADGVNSAPLRRFARRARSPRLTLSRSNVRPRSGSRSVR